MMKGNRTIEVEADKNPPKNLQDYAEKLGSESPKEEFIREAMDKCRVKRITVLRWLKNQYKPDGLKLQILSQMTGIPEENLFTEESSEVSIT